MYNLIKKRFIKNYQNTSSKEVRFRYGIAAGICGIISNVVLFAIKLAVGVLSGAISIVADAVNNLSDAGSSLVTILGFKLSNRPADAEHPFGHARYEYVTGLIVAFIVFIIGVSLGKSSVEKIINPTGIETSVWVVVVLVVAMLGKLWQGGLYRNFGKSIDSPALIATAADSRNDVLSTTMVLISVVIAMIWPSVVLDAYMGLAVSVIIVISSVKLIKDTVDPLLGSVPDKEFVKHISDKVVAYDGILGIHDLMVHNYGPSSVFASLHAEVSAAADVMESHDLIDNIERDFLREGIFMVIHMDPIVTDDPELNALRERIEAILFEEFQGQVTMHDFRMVKGVTHTNVLFDVVLPYGIKTSKAELIALIEEKVGEGENYFYVINIDNKFVE